MIYSIIEQHAEEAAFLYAQRSNAVVAPHYSLKDLSRLDSRLLAHLDGLNIARGSGWKTLEGVLKEREQGDVFVAASVAFASADRRDGEELFRFCAAAPECWSEVSAALGWLPFAEVKGHISFALKASAPLFRQIGLVASAFHGQDPGGALADGLHSPDASLCCHAARAAGLLGRCDLAPVLYDVLDSEDQFCRYSAAWSLSLLGHIRPLARLSTDLPLNKETRRAAINLIARSEGIRETSVWRQDLVGNRGSLRDALIAAGAAGDPALVPRLIHFMTVPELARVAAEAFSVITGLNLDALGLEAEPPPDFRAGPTEDPDDDDVSLDQDEGLPWPDQAAVESWWMQHQSEFQPGSRYLLGTPMTTPSLTGVLRIGRQRQRAAAALELTIRNPGTPLFNVEAPGFRQQQLLGIGR